MQSPHQGPWEGTRPEFRGYHPAAMPLQRTLWQRRGVRYALCIAAISALPAAWQARPRREQPIDMPGISLLARNLSRSSVSVTCHDNAKYAGDASIQLGRIRMNRKYCRSLSGLVANPPHIDASACAAVLVITHEATHILHWDYGEGETECAAVRNLPHTLDLLPLSPDDARRVLADARASHAAMPAMRDGLPNPYRSVC